MHWYYVIAPYVEFLCTLILAYYLIVCLLIKLGVIKNKQKDNQDNQPNQKTKGGKNHEDI